MTDSTNADSNAEDWREHLARIDQQQEINAQMIAALAERLTVSTQEHDRRTAEHDRRMAEHEQMIAAIAEQLTISTQEHDRRMAEHDRRMAEHDRRMAEIDQRLARLTQLTERFVGQTLSHEERLRALERAG